MLRAGKLAPETDGKMYVIKILKKIFSSKLYQIENSETEGKIL